MKSVRNVIKSIFQKNPDDRPKIQELVESTRTIILNELDGEMHEVGLIDEEEEKEEEEEKVEENKSSEDESYEYKE